MMSRTVYRVVSDDPKWKPTERSLYSNALVVDLGEFDSKANVLVGFLSGPLLGECRWMKPSELEGYENGSQGTPLDREGREQ